MSDQIDHRADREPVYDTPGKGAHPVFWLVVLAALLAFGWSFYNRQAGEATPTMVRTDAAALANPAVERKPQQPALPASPP